MPEDDLQTYSGTFEGVRTYTALQAKCMDAQDRATFYFAAHQHPTPAELEEGMERLMEYQQAEFYLVHVGKEMRRGLEDALKL